MDDEPKQPSPNLRTTTTRQLERATNALHRDQFDIFTPTARERFDRLVEGYAAASADRTGSFLLHLSYTDPEDVEPPDKTVWRAVSYDFVKHSDDPTTVVANGLVVPQEQGQDIEKVLPGANNLPIVRFQLADIDQAKLEQLLPPHASE